MSKKPQAAKKADNIVFFQRPAIGDKLQEASSLSSWMTFKNIVIGLGVATFLIFLGSAVSARIAFLFAALLGLTVLILFEMTSRRKWEGALVEQLQRMGSDYDRLVREVARNRNDMAVLKKSLSDAGTLARSYGKTPGDGVEQRMIRTIAEQLSKLAEPQAQDTVDEDAAMAEIAEVIPDTPVEEKRVAAPITDDGFESVRKLKDDQVILLVNTALKHDRVDLFLQPIVNLPQRKVRFYEMFSRIRIKEGVYLPAERYIEVAMRHDLVPAIDNLLLLRGLQVIRDTEEENYNRAFFCNITSLTLNDPKFMGDLVEFIAQNRLLAPRLVFELGQKDLATMNPDSLPVLDGLSSLGCRFSMDQVKSLSFDFAHLEARHIRFVKVDAAILMAEMKEVGGGLPRLKRLKAQMDTNGIDLIVEKVETERQILELMDSGLDYGQGYLFGKPALSEKV